MTQAVLQRPDLALAQPCRQLVAQFGWIGDQVGTTQAESSPWHAIKAGALGALHQGHPAGRAHHPQPTGSVGARARQHHRQAAVAAVLGQRFEQTVDRRAGAKAGQRIAEPQVAVGDGGVPVGGDHHDLSRLQRRWILGHLHRQRGDAAQQLRQLAGVVGGLMLGDHKGCPGACGQPGHQLPQGFKAAGRSSDRHHGAGIGGRGVHCCLARLRYRQADCEKANEWKPDCLLSEMCRFSKDVHSSSVVHLLALVLLCGAA